MPIHINTFKHIFLLHIINIFILQTISDTIQTQNPIKKQQQQKQLKYINHNSLTYITNKSCGLKDKNIYIYNGTFQSIGFFSNQNFTLFIQEDATNFSITGFTISKLITTQNLQQIKLNTPKMFQLTRNMNVSNDDIFSFDFGDSFEIIESEPGSIYYANLTIYGMCKSAYVSTVYKELQVQVRYFHQNYQQHQDTQMIKNQQNKIQLIQHTQTFKIPTTIYCIDGVSIKQANYFVTKLYFIVIVSVFGILLSFKPFRQIPFFMRLFGLIAYLWIQFKVQNIYEALFSTYGAMFLVVIYFRIFEQTSQNFVQSRRQTVLSKSYILVSFASALPLAVKSHLDDQSVQQKKIILYLVNIMMICNGVLFISSMINLTRFRHAFYYFLAIIFAQHYLYEHIRKLLAFNIIKLHVFSAPFECQSLFFAMWIIPLCDFFFKSYSSEVLYKFFILLIPLLAQPLKISYSTSFAFGITIWILYGRLSGRDLINIIKYKK